jgi:hypothetical protein
VQVVRTVPPLDFELIDSLLALLRDIFENLLFLVQAVQIAVYRRRAHIQANALQMIQNIRSAHGSARRGLQIFHDFLS